MNSEFRNKKFGFKRFLNTFKYSYQGLKYAYPNEQSMFIHAIVSLFAIILGIVFKISSFEWIITVLLIGISASLELLNTAIEAVCDMVTMEYNELAKIAKDTSSAALLIISIAAFIMGLIVYVPKFMVLF